MTQFAANLFQLLKFSQLSLIRNKLLISDTFCLTMKQNMLTWRKMFCSRDTARAGYCRIRRSISDGSEKAQLLRQWSCAFFIWSLPCIIRELVGYTQTSQNQILHYPLGVHALACYFCGTYSLKAERRLVLLNNAGCEDLFTTKLPEASQVRLCSCL